MDTGVEDRQLAGQASSVATSSQQHAVYGHMPEARKSFIATTMVHMVVTPVYGHSTCLVQAFFCIKFNFCSSASSTRRTERIYVTFHCRTKRASICIYMLKKDKTLANHNYMSVENEQTQVNSCSPLVGALCFLFILDGLSCSRQGLQIGQESDLMTIYVFRDHAVWVPAHRFLSVSPLQVSLVACASLNL